jgi:hypothetical protein
MKLDYASSPEHSSSPLHSQPSIERERSPSLPPLSHAATSCAAAATQAATKSSISAVRTAFNSGAAHLHHSPATSHEQDDHEGPSSRTRARRTAQGLNKPGSFQRINMDRGGTHAESFFTLSDEYIDQCFTTRGLPSITHNTEDEDNAYPPYDYTNCAETREIDMIPQCIQHELDTLYWCEDIPETMAWLASDPSVLTVTNPEH